MNNLGSDLAADRSALDPLDTPAPQLGFVRHEPLDTMLKLERLPPPVLSFSGTGDAASRAHARPSNPDSNAHRHRSLKLRLDLAELVLSKEENIQNSGDAEVIEGLNEVHRFLLHSVHLRLLQES